MSGALPSGPRGAFYLDIASPAAHLLAERILTALPGPVEWIPVLARGLPGGDPLGLGGSERERAQVLGSLEREAAALGLQPLRWPRVLPFDSEPAMLAATYARAIGRAVPFLQAALRQAYAGGNPMQERDYVLIAAAACEMHPRAVARAIDSSQTAAQLAGATEEAAALGVSAVPTIRLGETLFSGPRALERAVAARAGRPAGAAATKQAGLLAR